MATKTWNGSTGLYADPNGWLPAGVPVSGDTAIINAGTVAVAPQVLQGVLLQLDNTAGKGPTLNLVDTTLASSATVYGLNPAGFSAPPATVNVYGRVVDQGVTSFSGSLFGMSFFTDGAGTPATLINLGALNLLGASVLAFAGAGNPVGTIENESSIAVWNPTAGFQSPTLSTNITGTGVIMIAPNAGIDLAQAVTSGQLVRFAGGAGAGGKLQIDQPLSFQGTISGFSSGDLISVPNTPFTNSVYTPTSAHGGTLSLFNAGTLVGNLAFEGTYGPNDLKVAFQSLSSGQTNIQITTAVNAAQPIHFADNSLGQASTDAGIAYTGPVAGLDRQFLWSSADSAGLSSDAPNAFLKGGAGNDTLTVTTGTNVLDGGGGSNLLIGGTGPGSQDTFFLDGRSGQATYSAIANFHAGDQATIFGFHNGVSTLTLQDGYGVPGYQGLTIHSALGGAGTSENATLTFAGFDQTAFNQHFTLTTGTLNPGTAGAVDYFLVQYNK